MDVSGINDISAKINFSIVCILVFSCLGYLFAFHGDEVGRAKQGSFWGVKIDVESPGCFAVFLGYIFFAIAVANLINVLVLL